MSNIFELQNLSDFDREILKRFNLIDLKLQVIEAHINIVRQEMAELNAKFVKPEWER